MFSPLNEVYDTADLEEAFSTVVAVRQTALYPHMAAAPDVETARYALYFAAELGLIRREKKGNSYTVFPVAGPGPDIDFTTV